MKERIGLVVLGLLIASGLLFGQGGSPPAATSAPQAKQQAAEKANQTNAAHKILGVDAAQTQGPTATQIFADEAFFDSNKNMGIFSGRVKVTDPRFNLQSDKLTVFISKGENQGLERAVAEGTVVVVRDRPDPNGGAATRSVGRSEKAAYVAATGDMELTGTPRVQEGVNTHIATSPDTVMLINQNGQLTTHGPSRTEIRQQPKSDQAAEKSPSKTSATPKPPGPS